jgi:hypothetical protein
MATTPNIEPAFAQAGDTIAWTRDLSDYPAPAWVLKYRLINADARIDITAGASGALHAVSLSAVTTAAYTAGTYTWTAYVEGGTAERYTIGSGSMVIRPNLAAMASNYDARSVAKKALDDTRAAMATWIASNGQVQEYSIAGRTMKYASMADIAARIQLLEREVSREDAANKMAAGIQPARRLLVRF